MTGGINCNSGLAAVMASCIGLSYLYNSIFGLEIEHFLRYTEPMQPMWLYHSHHMSVARPGQVKRATTVTCLAYLSESP